MLSSEKKASAVSFLLTASVVSALPCNTMISSENNIDGMMYNSYRTTYAPKMFNMNNSTFSPSNYVLPNTIDMVKKMEITKVITLIEKEFEVKVIDNMILNSRSDKACLYVKCSNYESLENDYDAYSDFELSLYVSLKETLAQNTYIDMIALI